MANAGKTRRGWKIRLEDLSDEARAEAQRQLDGRGRTPLGARRVAAPAGFPLVHPLAIPMGCPSAEPGFPPVAETTATSSPTSSSTATSSRRTRSDARRAKREALVARDLAALERVRAWTVGATRVAWCPLSCPRPKGNSKRPVAPGVVLSPEGEQEHQEALVALLGAAWSSLEPALDPDPLAGALERDVVFVLPTPRAGAPSPHPHAKAHLTIEGAPRRRPQVPDVGGLLKMVDDALQAAGWLEDDVQIVDGSAAKAWAGAPATRTLARVGLLGVVGPELGGTWPEPGYLVALAPA